MSSEKNSEISNFPPKLELKEKAADQDDEIDEREEKNRKEYLEKTRDLEEQYEDLLDEERGKAGKTAEQLADELDSHQDELSEREQKMKGLLNGVQEQNRKYEANETMYKKEFDGLVKEIESLKYGFGLFFFFFPGRKLIS